MAYRDIWTSVHNSWRNRRHFVEGVLMSEAPVDEGCTKFADYLTRQLGYSTRVHISSVSPMLDVQPMD